MNDKALREVKHFPDNPPLLQALLEVVRDLDERRLEKGCTIEVPPLDPDNNGFSILVNWNS